MANVTLEPRSVILKSRLTGRPEKNPYCTIAAPAAKRFAVITDIHGNYLSREIFLMFCRQAQISQVVSLGDNEGEDRSERPYIDFVGFANEKPGNVFFGLLGDDCHEGQYAPYFAPGGMGLSAFISQGEHIFCHDGMGVDSFIEQGGIAAAMLATPLVIWHGHTHRMTFDQAYKHRFDILASDIVGFEPDKYYRVLQLCRGQTYWVNPGDQYKFAQFAVFDGEKNEITMIKLKISSNLFSQPLPIPLHLQPGH